jgi:hypothetical protein
MLNVVSPLTLLRA